MFCTRKRSGEGEDQVELKEATTGLRTQRPADQRQRFYTPLPMLSVMSPTSIECDGHQATLSRIKRVDHHGQADSSVIRPRETPAPLDSAAHIRGGVLRLRRPRKRPARIWAPAARLGRRRLIVDAETPDHGKGVPTSSHVFRAVFLLQNAALAHSTCRAICSARAAI